MNRVLVFVLGYMNKFVKGAKNLALTLSFVTVAACGGVKNTDLDKVNKEIVGLKSAVKDVKEKMAERNSEGKSNEVAKKYVDYKELEELKNNVVKKEVLQNAIDRDPLGFVKFLGKVDGVVNKKIEGGVIEFSDLGANGGVRFKISKGNDVFEPLKENYEDLSDESINKINSYLLLGCTVKGLDKIKFSDGGAAKKVKFGDGVFDLSNGVQTNTLKFLISLIKVDDKFTKLNLSAIHIVKGGEGLIGLGGKDLNNNLDGVFDLFDSIKKGCVEKVEDEEGRKMIKFVKGQGWTSDGSRAIEDDLVTVA